MELPFDPAIPLLGIYPKNPQTPIQKNICTSVFTAVLFTIAKTWKQSKFPAVDKNAVVRLHMEYYTAIKKKDILTFETA